jgi:hypothetical protein
MTAVEELEVANPEVGDNFRIAHDPASSSCEA